MDIVLIPPDGLRNVWGKVREGLATMPADDWIAEDVYHAIRCGESALYVGADEDGYAGFMVLRMLKGEFSGLPRLHVWLTFNQGSKDIFAAGEAMIREVAQKSGAKKITFGSPRLGWSKRYTVESVNYAIPLQE